MTDDGWPAGPQPVRVMVLGGYGHFGTRVCRALADESAIQLIITGRSLDRANALRDRLGANRERHEMAAVDHGATDFGARLAALYIDVVIHTGGPFQGQNYHVAEACIAAGIHYIDLADGREFVANIKRLDRAAREAGVLAVSGASTLPAVSSAVVEHYLPNFETLTSIRASIAPGQRTPRGVATLEAVLSYCGRPFVQLEQGEWQTVYGWQGLQRFRYPELGSRWLGACDVPDLSLFPQHYPGLQTMQFRTGLELSVMQWSMWGLAWLVRAGVVKQLERYARPLKRISGRFDRFGTDNGGMHVGLAGVGHDGAARSIDWFLTARQGHGPEIPCVPAIVLARKLAAGKVEWRGAMPCVGLISLDEFGDAVSHLNISSDALESG